MTKVAISLFFSLLITCVHSEELVEEVILISPKLPAQLDKLLSTVDALDAQSINQINPKDLKTLLRTNFAIDISSNGGPGQISSIFLRGSNSNQTVVKINGIKINPSTAGGAALYNLDPLLISRIEIGSGPLSSLHGSDAIGGIINIYTTPQGEENFLTFSLNSGSNNLFKKGLNAFWEKNNYAVSFYSIDSDTDGFPTLTSSNLDRGYNNFSQTSSFDYNSRSFKASISSWSSNGKTEYLDFFGIPVSQDYENTAYSILLSYLLQNNKKIDINFGSSKDFIKQKEGNYLEIKDLTLTDRNSFEISLYSKIKNNNNFIMGFSQNAEKVDYSVYGDEFMKSLKTKSIFTSSKFFSKNALFGFSVRLSDHETYGKNTSWNLGYKKRLNNSWSLILNSGMAFRSPNSSELFGFGSNINLKPETSRSSELRLERTINKDNILGLTIFTYKTDNLINYDFSESKLKNIDQAQNEGSEMRYKWTGKTFRGDMLLRVQSPKDSNRKNLLRRSRKAMSCNIYRDFKGATINFNLTGFDRRKDIGNKNLPGYFLLNTSFTKELNKKLSFSLSLENILDKEYFTAAGFNGYYRNQERAIWVHLKYDLLR